MDPTSKITILFPPGDQLTSILLSKVGDTTIEGLLTRLCALRAIEFNLKKLRILNDVGADVDLSKTVSESGVYFLEIVDKKAEKQKKSARKDVQEVIIPRGLPKGVVLEKGKPCLLSLDEQLFEDEKKALHDIKDRSPLLCKNFSDEFVVATLFARKFDLTRTADALQKSLQWRKDYGLLELPKLEEISPALVQFMLTIPGTRDKEGRFIRYINPGPDFRPNVEPWTLPNIRKFFAWFHYIGVFSEGMDGLRNGVHGVINITEFSWKKFDMDFQKNTISMVNGVFPLSIRKISVVNPPAVFGALHKILKTIMKEKIANRITPVDIKGLLKDVETDNLQAEYGGTIDFSVEIWLGMIKEFVEKNEERLREPGKPQ